MAHLLPTRPEDSISAPGNAGQGPKRPIAPKLLIFSYLRYIGAIAGGHCRWCFSCAGGGFQPPEGGPQGLKRGFLFAMRHQDGGNVWTRRGESVAEKRTPPMA